MAHGYAVVDGYGVELCSVTPHGLNLLLDNLSNLMKMGMTRYKLRKAIHDSDDWFAKLLVLHSGCHPKGSGSCHSATLSAYRTSQLMLHLV